MKKVYQPLVRQYHPTGFREPYFAGCTKRDGNSRMTDICAHQHAGEAEAQGCADHLAHIRNQQIRKQ